MIYVIRTLALTLVEVLCFQMFLDTFLERRKMKFKLNYILLILLWGLGFGMACISNLLLRVVIVIGTSFVFMRILYRGTSVQILFLIIAEYALGIIVDSIVFLSIQYLLQIRINDFWPYSIMVPILCKVILLIINMIFYNIFNQNQRIGAIEKHEWLRFILFPLLSIVLIVCMRRIESDMAMMLNAIGLLIIDFLFFYLVQDVIKRENMLREKHILEIQMRNQIQLYQSMEDSYGEQQKKVHDFRNHMSCMQGLLEDGKQDKALDYIRNLYGTWNQKNIGLNTNHAIVNSILRQKYQFAKQSDVHMILNVGDLQNLSMEDEDVVILLTNLLDNGIEGCKRLEEKPKELKCSIRIERGKLEITTQNPVEKEIQKMKGFLTLKSNKREHGIGMKNIENVVEKYHGEDIVQCNNGLFTHTVIIGIQ